MTPEPLYSVGTWDGDAQAFTPQAGLTVPAYNITRSQLRQALRELKRLGYLAFRMRLPNGEHESDLYVLIERTDGQPPEEIRKGWDR